MAGVRGDCNQNKPEPGLRDIIVALVRRRLQRNKYNTLLRQALARLETPVNYDEHCFINTILEYEEKNLDYCDRADIEEAVWTNDDRVLNVPSEGFLRFTKTINRIFNKVDWSRVVMLLVVTGVLAENAMEHENIRRIQDLIEWCVCYFREKNIDAWVQAKGGWTNLECEMMCQTECKDKQPPCEGKGIKLDMANLGSVLGSIAKAVIGEQLSQQPQQPQQPQQTQQPQEESAPVAETQPEKDEAKPEPEQPASTQVVFDAPSTAKVVPSGFVMRKEPANSKSEAIDVQPGTSKTLQGISASQPNIAAVAATASSAKAAPPAAQEQKEAAAAPSATAEEKKADKTCWSIKISTNLN